MRRIYIIFITLVLLTFFTKSTLFAQLIQVCIDPGHGGPGASKYGANGDGEGTDGPLPSGQKLSEEWVNLQVALQLRDSIDNFCGGNVSMTRTTDTQYVSLDRRAYLANFADCTFDPRPEWCGADEFIPIHHNGLELWQQGIETFWCNRASVLINDQSYPRNITKMLAQKIFWRLRDKFTYPPYDTRGCKIDCYPVLRNTTMASCLSEATNMHNEDEAILFDDPSLAHVKDEAGVIYRGWRSYYDNNGVVTVAVRGLCDLSGKVIVDGIDRQSPYNTSWTNADFQFHNMCAYEGLSQFCGSTQYTYQYHHWKEIETGNTVYFPYNCYSTYVDPNESTHTFIAYYKGGPYYASLFMPDGGEEWLVGDSQVVIWGFGMGETSPGLDSTTLIDIFLDRNSGAGGYRETLFTGIPRKDYVGVAWKVTGPASNKCRIKIIAHDCVGNTASDVSSYDFTIRFPNIAGDANTDGAVTIADVVYLVNYLFKGGPPPAPLWKGDANGDCKVTAGDAVYLVSYLMKGGPPPVCNPNCWPCLRALAKKGEKPYTKDPSFLEKIFKGDKESIEKKIESDFKSGNEKPALLPNPDLEKAMQDTGLKDRIEP